MTAAIGPVDHLHQVIEAPLRRKQDNRAGGTLGQSVISLKAKCVFMGWILSMSSFYFAVLSRKLESE
jgi:hypothetical protein